MRSDGEHLSMCSCVTCVSSLVSVCSGLLPTFVIGFFILLTFKSYLYIWGGSPVTEIPYLFYRSLVFSVSGQCRHRVEVFGFNEVQLISDFFHGSAFGVAF